MATRASPRKGKKVEPTSTNERSVHEGEAIVLTLPTTATVGDTFCFKAFQNEPQSKSTSPTGAHRSRPTELCFTVTENLLQEAQEDSNKIVLTLPYNTVVDDKDLAAMDKFVRKMTPLLKGDAGDEIVVGETRLRKKFGGKYYSGTVVSQDDLFYGIKYDDGDDEEIDLEELLPLVKEHDVHISNDKHRKQASVPPKKNKRSVKNEPVDTPSPVPMAVTSSSRSGRKTKAVNYQEQADMSDDAYSVDSSADEDDTENLKPAKNGKKKETNGKKKETNGKKNGNKRKTSLSSGKGKKKKTKTGRRSSATLDDSDASVASIDMNPPSDDDEMNFFAASDSDEEKAPKSKKKGSAATTKGKGPNMAEAFKPTNNPLFKKESWEEMKAKYSYLDPCGMEATDDIIGGLVGNMVEKLGSLLERALSSPKSFAVGSKDNPMKLGTACSGTDAPALALGMVQEQMALRGMENLFHYEHQYSCEVEPFKQAYLARNFDSILYPDIAKLTDKEPRDVYQQIQPLPETNIFVAGTSCKNFSMLMSKFRIDIEDKGCSGETFLAATEVLFQEKPKFAILENVTKAPWEKMSEYITGRVEIANCELSNTKGKEIKVDQKDKGKELKFLWDSKTKKILVDEVPPAYGVRCGAPVKGFIVAGSSKLQRLKWSEKSKRQVSLRELLKTNALDKAKGTLVFDLPVTYCTKHIKVDSKKFGVPQTRERVYMFVWQPEGGKVDDDLGDYWEAIVRHLEAQVRHSLEAFMLQVDHDIIRVFREGK
jgi:hypothetical protein